MDGSEHQLTADGQRVDEREDPTVQFGTALGEIHVELHRTMPTYIRIRPGDYLQEGDAFHRDQLQVSSPSLRTWKIVEITDDRVVLEDVDAGEETTMDREEVERRLATGRYSSNLTDFEWLSVYQVGNWDDYAPDDEDADLQYTDQPYVAVVAYGDNGLRYGRRYRFVDPGSNELALWKADEPRGGFSEAVEARLDRRVREVLETDGYTIVE